MDLGHSWSSYQTLVEEERTTHPSLQHMLMLYNWESVSILDEVSRFKFFLRFFIYSTS